MTSAVRKNDDKPSWEVFLIPEDEEGPAFAFTLGLYRSFQHPEVLIMGLPLEAMHPILNGIGEQVGAGCQFSEGTLAPNILEGYNCTFRTIDRGNYAEVLGAAIESYRGKEFPALQCFWPDREGHFPWQFGFEERLLERQWFLFDDLTAGS